jgi:hypothetical protein
VAPSKLLLLPGCGFYVAYSVVMVWPGCDLFLELLLLPGFGIYGAATVSGIIVASAVAWLRP